MVMRTTTPTDLINRIVLEMQPHFHIKKERRELEESVFATGTDGENCVTMDRRMFIETKNTQRKESTKI